MAPESKGWMWLFALPLPLPRQLIQQQVKGGEWVTVVAALTSWTPEPQKQGFWPDFILRAHMNRCTPSGFPCYGARLISVELCIGSVGPSIALQDLFLFYFAIMLFCHPICILISIVMNRLFSALLLSLTGNICAVIFYPRGGTWTYFYFFQIDSHFLVWLFVVTTLVPIILIFCLLAGVHNTFI